MSYEEFGGEADTHAEEELSRHTIANGVRQCDRFPIMSFKEFVTQQPLNWLIHGMLPKDGLGVIFGAPSSGKSFIVLDIAMKVALGLAWQNRKVAQGRVVYIAAEGSRGLVLRVRAYADYNFFDEAEDFFVLPAAPDFRDTGDVEAIRLAIRKLGGADLIIIDPLAQVIPGANENLSDDVSKALAHARLIQNDTGALVLFVHHSGKDHSKGPRGWSGLRGAADVEMEVFRGKRGERTLRITKSKDGPGDIEWSFKLETVQLPTDKDEDYLTSCVAVPCDLEVPVAKAIEMPISKTPKGLGLIQRIVLRKLHEWVNPDANGIMLDELVSEVVKDLKPRTSRGAGRSERGTQKGAVDRAVTALIKRGEISVVDDRVFTCK